MSSLILLRAVLAKHLHSTGFLQPAGGGCCVWDESTDSACVGHCLQRLVLTTCACADCAERSGRLYSKHLCAVWRAGVRAALPNLLE